MNILYVSSIIKKDSSIAALRPRAHIDYLNRKGHSVSVVYSETNRPDPTYSIPDMVEEYVVPQEDEMERNIYSKMHKCTHLLKRRERKGNPDAKAIIENVNSISNQRIRNNKTSMRGAQWLKSKRKYLISYITYRIYIHAAKAWANNVVLLQKKLGKHYDIVVTSYDPLGNFFCGILALKMGIADHWICDLRDTMHDGKKRIVPYVDRIMKAYERRAARLSDYITVVSNGQKDMLIDVIGNKSNVSDKVRVVYSGFTPKSTASAPPLDGVMRIVYTGTIYENVQDASMLFKAISQLIQKHQINRRNIEVIYAGQSSNELVEQAKKYDLEEIVINHGLISRIDLGTIQDRADCLLLLTSNDTRSRGILTGKFLEYMGLGKPIIAITTGDLANGEVTSLIQTMNLGVAAEYLSEKEDLPLLCDYIKEQYDRKASGQQVFFNPVLEKVGRFENDSVCSELERLCQNIKAHMKSNNR